MEPSFQCVGKEWVVIRDKKYGGREQASSQRPSCGLWLLLWALDIGRLCSRVLDVGVMGYDIFFKRITLVAKIKLGCVSVGGGAKAEIWRSWCSNPSCLIFFQEMVSGMFLQEETKDRPRKTEFIILTGSRETVLHAMTI